MKEDLTHLLICWKNDERRLGIRKVKIRNSPQLARASRSCLEIKIN